MEKPETGEWKCPQGRFHRNEARLRYGSTVKDCEKVLYRFQGSEDRSRKEEVRDLNCILTTAQRMILNKGQLAEENWNMETCKKLSSENGVLGSEGDLSTTSILNFPNREKRKGTDWSQDQATKKSSYKERRVDAKAPYADEGRGKLRKAAGNCKQVMIRRYPNGGTQPE